MAEPHCVWDDFMPEFLDNWMTLGPDSDLHALP